MVVRAVRYVVFILAVIVAVHYMLASFHHDYQKATSKFTPHLQRPSFDYNALPYAEDLPSEKAPATNHASSEIPSSGSSRLANATFVMLARNSDLDGAIRSIRAIEDRFNSKHGYPYVFLNDASFSDEFKRRISVLTASKVEFGVVPTEHWVQPSWIDEDKAAAARQRMVATNVKYGGSIPYRNMCRFNSGFFFKHELLQKYRWYWRVEPDVKFHCDINRDPFIFMEENNKTYGFTITVYEISATIRTLWNHVTDFVKEHPQYISENNAMGFLSNNKGQTYNRCHFWSNFEIADMDFWRGPAYSAFFEYLDSKGGFYYERWGDAPVHSIAAALFLNRDQIHFFENIGYQHDDWSHCPLTDSVWEEGRCSCSQRNSFDYDPSSCKHHWDNFMRST